MNLLRIRRFVADSTLGRSAKWLRLMGFDTAYDSKPPDSNRLRIGGADDRAILTRCSNVYHHLIGTPALLMGSEKPQRQICQIISELHIRWEEIRPFTRCAACNTVLHLLPKADVAGLVPDYVFQHHMQFNQCPRCQRIYWPGSHSRRWLNMIRPWFEGAGFDDAASAIPHNRHLARGLTRSLL